jgi:aminoglycoside phosphotransferase (APT) family kinase protein
MMLWWANHEWTFAKSGSQYSDAFLDQLHGRMRSSIDAIDEPPLTMIHGDCRAAHFIMMPTDERVAGILDFGDASIGDPAWDLAVFDDLGTRAPGRRPGGLQGRQLIS